MINIKHQIRLKLLQKFYYLRRVLLRRRDLQDNERNTTQEY